MIFNLFPTSSHYLLVSILLNDLGSCVTEKIVKIRRKLHKLPPWKLSLYMYLYLSQFVNLSNLYLSHLALLPATVKDSFYTSIQRERFPGVNVLSSQLCPTLCDPLGCSHQAPLSMGFFRQEYWVVISFSRGSFRSSNQTRVSCISCIAGGFFTAEPSGKS